MISKSTLRKIGHIVGADYLVHSGDMMADYATDGTRLEYMPDAVVFPADSDQVSQILFLATKKGFPVIPRGGGSGMSGGALAVRGGLVMAMNRFNRILFIDQENLISKVEPGVITSDLQDAVEELGLFYPPDPASIKLCTLGGNIAECAGGLRAVKYGVTRDYVLGLTIVLPTGEIIRTGVETMKGVAGYDLTRLIVGSEGTLAVVTDITLRLVPRPQSKKTMIAFFPDVESAIRTVTNIIRTKIIPTILEFIDRLCLDCVMDKISIPVPERAKGMLLIETDGDETLVEKGAGLIREVCNKSGCLYFEEAANEEQAERLWEARRNVSPSLLTLRPHKISEDIVVPRSRMPELFAYLEELSHQFGLPVPAFGHAGDGNIHVNVMLDKDNQKEEQNAHALVIALFKRVIIMGGTITGEHGIGITKSPYLEMEISRPGLELMKRIKKAFDPKGILNPGKIFRV
ncbi:Glycolate oxidase subunit GlcD [uncultured Desulfobacterium sp.]|uniref:Glycolate oxidase subunit GlcD n=1 Tax=uncultured Desulfobacterium sp. TaxID=201089 RepID=A0A445N320_9BACT|nr:Glycolate oxidase subunit GlcD [uncultured Desulfobacterium sp.]